MKISGRKKRKVKHSQTCWEHFDVSLYVSKMLGDFVKQLEKHQALQNVFLLLDFTYIVSFCDDNLRSRQVPSCIHFSNSEVFLFAVRVHLLPVQLCSYSTIKKLHQCFTCLGEDAQVNKRRRQYQRSENESLQAPWFGSIRGRLGSLHSSQMRDDIQHFLASFLLGFLQQRWKT